MALSILLLNGCGARLTSDQLWTDLDADMRTTAGLAHVTGVHLAPLDGGRPTANIRLTVHTDGIDVDTLAVFATLPPTRRQALRSQAVPRLNRKVVVLDNWRSAWQDEWYVSPVQFRLEQARLALPEPAPVLDLAVDAHAPYALVSRVIDTARAAGFERLALLGDAHGQVVALTETGITAGVAGPRGCNQVLLDLDHDGVLIRQARPGRPVRSRAGAAIEPVRLTAGESDPATVQAALTANTVNPCPTLWLSASRGAPWAEVLAAIPVAAAHGQDIDLLTSPAAGRPLD